MSLNVLVSAAVQRTGQPLVDISQEDELKKKRKRVKPDVSVITQTNPISDKMSPGPPEDEEEKQRKRRAQIAEASRRSRARRKKEFQDFKEENDQLWSQNMLLRKTLQDLGVDVPAPLISRVDRGSSTPGGGASHNNSSDDEDEEEVNPSACASPGTSLASSPINQQSVQQAAATAAASVVNTQHATQLHWVTLGQSAETVDNSESSPLNPSGFQEFCQFFERRLSWYFTQLKSDAIRSFASQLPYEEKQKIAGLQVKLVLGEGISPTVTPNLSASAAVARQASATSAEQAVDQDKNVRL